jgi:hypothetical protein
MGALTIKSYAFEYRPWELEKYKVPNFNSNFPETLILYYKNKKLVRVSGGLMSNQIRFCQTTFSSFLKSENKIKNILFSNLFGTNKIRYFVTTNNPFVTSRLDIKVSSILAHLGDVGKKKIHNKMFYFEETLFLTKKKVVLFCNLNLREKHMDFLVYIKKYISETTFIIYYYSKIKQMLYEKTGVLREKQVAMRVKRKKDFLGNYFLSFTSPTTKTLIKNPCEFSLAWSGVEKTKKPFGQVSDKRTKKQKHYLTVFGKKRSEI